MIINFKKLKKNHKFLYPEDWYNILIVRKTSSASSIPAEGWRLSLISSQNSLISSPHDLSPCGNSRMRYLGGPFQGASDNVLIFQCRSYRPSLQYRVFHSLHKSPLKIDFSTRYKTRAKKQLDCLRFLTS